MKSSWKTLIHTYIWILINLKNRFHHVSEICPLEEKQINPKQTSRKLYIVKTDKLKQDSGGYNLSFSHFSSVRLLFSTYEVLPIRIINFDNYVSSALLESLGILVQLNLGIKYTKTLQK